MLEVLLVGVMRVYSALMQIPGLDTPDLTLSQQASGLWEDMGFMRWPLAFCLTPGVLANISKFSAITAKAAKTKRILKDVDELLTQQRIREAPEMTRDTESPAANTLYAGLERH